MIRFALTAAAACLVAIPALAGDARLLTHRYNAEEVVRVQGQIGVQASIAFADDELIENVAIGDSASWQVTPNKRANLLFVKPLSPRARTNMTVVTDRRTYFSTSFQPAAVRPSTCCASRILTNPGTMLANLAPCPLWQ